MSRRPLSFAHAVPGNRRRLVYEPQPNLHLKVSSMPTASEQRRFDLIVRGGTVIDGTGAPPASADVGVKDGRTLAGEPLEAIQGVPELDARGCLVTPGFIDVHSHSDFTL